MSSTASLKHGLYLQNSPRYLDDLARPEVALEYAIAAEDAGWDGVYLADSLGSFDVGYFDPWITHAAIAARTDDLLLASWVTPVPRRQPWQLATDLATLDALSDGRVILGAGFGAPWNYETTGIGYEPADLGRRYDEALDVIDQLWNGGEVDFEGEHFTIDGLELPLEPVQEPRPPIVMGCWWPNKRPFERAAEWDGIMPVGPSFYGGEGVQGEQPTGTIEEEVEQMIATYRDAGGDGEIVMPIDVPQAPDDFIDVCLDHGMTWTLSTNILEADDHEGNLERIADGPPA